MTHYVPPFVTIYRGRQIAVCGEPVDKNEHSSEPDCVECKSWLAALEEEDAETARRLEEEFPEYKGRLVL